MKKFVQTFSRIFNFAPKVTKLCHSSHFCIIFVFKTVLMFNLFIKILLNLLNIFYNSPGFSYIQPCNFYLPL